MDGSLFFRLLVVAEGLSPQAVEKVDPRGGPIRVPLARLDARRLAPGRAVRGSVLDPDGEPVPGARVTPVGMKTAKGGWWGATPGVDQLAVTDFRGGFVLTCDEADVSVHVRVQAEGLATGTFPLLAAGPKAHVLRMSRGATVRGRVLDGGKPRAGAVVALLQADRGSNSFIGGAREAVTDAKGRFEFPNVGAKEEYYLYGTMKDAAEWGKTLPLTKVKVEAEGRPPRPVELVARPCYRISGRVSLPGGDAAPAGLMLSLSRQHAWDTQAVKVDREGRFTFRGLPAEQVDIWLLGRGYHFSAKNTSAHPFWPRSLIGRVEGDVRGLHIRLEVGDAARKDRDPLPKEVVSRMIKRRDELEKQPLRGVEGDEK